MYSQHAIPRYFPLHDTWHDSTTSLKQTRQTGITRASSTRRTHEPQSFSHDRQKRIKSILSLLTPRRSYYIGAASSHNLQMNGMSCHHRTPKNDNCRKLPPPHQKTVHCSKIEIGTCACTFRPLGTQTKRWCQCCCCENAEKCTVSWWPGLGCSPC